MSYRAAEPPPEPPVYPPMEGSDIGPSLLAILALYLLVQGMIYVFRPEMIGRPIGSPEKLRRNGFIITALGAGLFYIAVSWWLGF